MEWLASHTLNYTSGHAGARGISRSAEDRTTFGPSRSGWITPPPDGLSAYSPAGKTGTVAPLECISGGDVNIMRPVSVLGSPGRHRTTDISQDGRTTDLEFGNPIEYNGWFFDLARSPFIRVLAGIARHPFGYRASYRIRPAGWALQHSFETAKPEVWLSRFFTLGCRG